MRKSIFLTTAPLQTGHGGGNVSLHELNALKSKTEVLAAFDSNDLMPMAHHLPWNEFLVDYIAWEKTKDLQPDLIFTNGNPFGITVQHFQDISGWAESPLMDVKLIADCPAHDLADSIKEYEMLTGMKYAEQYPHNVYPELVQMQTRHLRMADVILCPSQYSVEALKKQFQFKRAVVIPHGCDPVAEVKPYPQIYRVGHAGVFGSDKGQVYLMQAWLQLQLKHASMVIAGKGSENFKKTMRSIAQQMGFKSEQEMPNTQYLGYIPDINVFYRNISVYVQPSVTEGFGIEVLEAMMHGRPVIVSDGAGASELVEHGKTGFVFPKRDSNKLAEYIDYFNKNPSEIAKFGAKARETAMNYTWNKIEKQIADLIESV